MLGRGFVKRYYELSAEKDSFLCVGIDPSVSSMRAKNVVPHELIEREGLIEGVKRFCTDIVESVSPYTPIIKPNAQFLVYPLGYDDIQEIVETIHEGGCLALLDIKLSDIGSTMEAGLYWIDNIGFDACTFSPFPGYENGTDAVYRWAETKDKGIFALCRMSNPGTHDYQSRTMNGEVFYRVIAKDAVERGCNGFVVGCTATKELGEIREIIGSEPLILSPGLGAQSGDAQTALKLGANEKGEGIIISSSRSIDYAYEEYGWKWERYGEAAGIAAKKKRDYLNALRERVFA